MSEYKNILIIGLSTGGVTTFKSLVSSKLLPSSYRVIAVDQHNFAYWPIGALRAAVVPGWEDKVIAPLEGLYKEGERHLVLGGVAVVSLDMEKRKARLSEGRSELGGSNVIDYEYIVIATGSNYGVPARPPKSAKTIQDAKAFLQSLQHGISSSKLVIIVGAGPVGMEFAGEVASHFKGADKKEVILVSSGERLLPEPQWKPAFREALMKDLTKVGVKLFMGAKAELPEGMQTGKVQSGTKVTVRHTASGETGVFEPDFVFIATGNSPSNSLFPEILLSPETHRLLTNSDLSVPSPAVHAYALGDAIDRDVKLSAAIGPQAGVVVKNLLAEISDKGCKKIEHKGLPSFMLVPIGENGGAGQMFGFKVGAWVTSTLKGKSLFTSKFLANYAK